MYILTDAQHIVFYISTCPRNVISNGWHEYPNYSGPVPNLGDYFIPGTNEYIVRNKSDREVKRIPKEQ